ncbi:MAG: flagellar hook protein FlgE, partial [Bryobacteraceae bacterium]
LMDAAIKGDGFFVVRDLSSGPSYTRAGNFLIDANGYLVTQTGQRVQGWGAGNTGLNTNVPITDISLPVGALRTPNATTNFSFDVNLDSNATVGTTFSSPIEVADSLGTTHVLTATFTNTGPNAWTFELAIPAADVGQVGAPVVVLPPTAMTFSAAGLLLTPAAGQVVPPIGPLANGAANLAMTWDFYTAQGTPRVTQFAHPSSVSANAQNGGTTSQLVKVALEDGGLIVAQYSNGQQRVVAQLALAVVRNPETLLAVGDNLFKIGSSSALPAVGPPDTGGRGQILGGALESSNVDIAREFTNLIVYQRGYQANSRVITTADEISQETINLKR